jgi:hypothetical protein
MRQVGATPTLAGYLPWSLAGHARWRPWHLELSQPDILCDSSACILHLPLLCPLVPSHSALRQFWAPLLAHPSKATPEM